METSTSLAAWGTTGTFIESETTTKLVVRDTFTIATAPRRFMRLQVRVKP